MKRLSIQLITTAVLLISLSQQSFSQTSKFSLSLNSLTTNFDYGNLNTVLKPYKKDFKGLEIGGSYQIGLTKKFSLVPELSFAMKGGVLKEKNPLTINKSVLKLFSAEIPLLARVHFNKLYVNAGPYVGYTLGGRLKVDGSTILPAKSNRISFGNLAGDFRRWDFGAVAGGGYNFNVKKSILTLDARYGYGLTNVSKSVERYNRVFNLSLLLSKP